MKRRAVPVVVLVVAFGAMAGAVRSQEPAAPPAKPMMGGKMMDECKAMMAKHKAMREEMAAMDTRLDALVATMNAARGAEKTDAVAAVVGELVAQRKAMHSRMMGTGPAMMKHMMRHAHGGADGAMMGMADCPMMQAHPADEQPKHH